MAEHSADEKAKVMADFKEAVTLSAKQLESWLETAESKSVGQTPEGQSESTGHKEGHRIIDILHKKQAELSDDDYAHMAKVVGYVHRHLKQRPKGDVTDTRWRYSLKNWGHDPL